MTDNTFNGWANYETWNVSLYIQNEYQFYKAALSYVDYQNTLCLPIKYDEYIAYFMDILGKKTADGVEWNDKSIDRDEMNEMLTELMD